MSIKLNKSKFILFWMTLIIILMSISPEFMLNDRSMNVVLLGVMGLSPIILLFTVHSFGKLDALLILFLLSIVLTPLLNHPESMRWSTVIYSWMFGLTFLVYDQLLTKRVMTIEHFEKIMRYFIYAYGFVLLVQQFCVLTGLPIFSSSHYNPMEPWKLSSLAAEPSWSGRIVAFLMFTYIIATEMRTNKKYIFKASFKEDKWLWIVFFWTMVTMGSATAFLFMVIVLSVFLRLRNVIGLIILGMLLLGIISFFNITVMDRTWNTVLATLTLDPNVIIETDHSASFRIIPFIVLPKIVGLTSIDDWFGYGIDSVGNFLYLYLYGVDKGYTAGGMLQVWIEYGFVSFVLFIIFSLFSMITKSHTYLSIIFWSFLVFMYGINSQIVWMAIIIMHTLVFLQRNRTQSKKVL